MHAALHRSQTVKAAAPSDRSLIAYVVSVDADSGVQRYGSLMSGTNQPPPGGASSQQTGLVRAQGVLSTTAALAAGQYSLSFQMANRSNYGGQQAVQVRVDGSTLPGSYTPSTAFASYSASFAVASAGNKVITFVGLNAGDNTALIDNVALTPVASSLTPPSGCTVTGATSLTSGQQGSYSVTCSAGSAPLSYAWSRTPTGFTSTAQSFTNTPFSSADTTVASATYSVNVSNAAGNQVTSIVVANGSFTGPPPSTAPETLTFIHPNVSGSPIMATDAAGNVAWREDYSAFGERTKNAANANSGTAANQNWFIGKPQDAHTGLVYFGARWYDPVVGRFLGFDPAPVDEGNPHSFNRYAYGNNNPNKFLDPDGRESQNIIARATTTFVNKSIDSPQSVAARDAVMQSLRAAEATGDKAAIGVAAEQMAGLLGAGLGVVGKTGVASKNASDLPVVKAGTAQWDKAVESMGAMGKGKVNVRTETATDAKTLLQDSRGSMDRRKQYTTDSYKKGYESHNEKNARELGAGNNLPHLKWKDDKSSGHIYYDKPN